MNLRDSGVTVIVANRPDSANGRRAVDAGFAPLPIEDAVARADLVIVALPDEAHAAVWSERIAPHLCAGAIVGFLPGFSVHFGLVDPSPGVGTIMVAPKGPGATLRDRFVGGQGIPCLFAVHREVADGADTGERASTSVSAEAIGLAWANGIGCSRAAIVFTSFAHETETDLFGEQAVLCGGLSELIVAAFEVLVDAGYPAELAYLECCQEVKQVADLVYERGLAGTMAAISNTAEFGASKAGPTLVDDALRGRLRTLLSEVRDGTFARTMCGDYNAGFPWFEARRRARREHALEPAGAAVRAWFPWLGNTDAESDASGDPPRLSGASHT